MPYNEEVQLGGDVAQDGTTQLGGFNEDIQPPLVEGDVPVVEPTQEELQLQQDEESLYGLAEMTENYLQHFASGPEQFAADKIGRLAGGFASIIGGVDDAIYGGVQTVANLFLDDKIDTKEERAAMIEYIRNASPLLIGTSGAGAAALAHGADSVSDFLNEFADPLTQRIETRDSEGDIVDIKGAYEEYGDDFITAFEQGDIGAGTDLLIGDTIEALPSVAAAFTGVGGLTLIGASAFGNKYTDEFDNLVLVVVIDHSARHKLSACTGLGD